MTALPAAHESVRFHFTSFMAAAEALLLVIEDARSTESFYTITGLSPDKILKHGLLLEGDVADISKRVALLEGAVRS